VRLILLSGYAATVAAVLAGCSDSRITTSSDSTPALSKTDDRAAVRPASATIGQRFANVALDDHQLRGIRGGVSTGSGMVVNFSFQEATYVNHNLTQSIVVPTMTISPGSASAGSAATQVSAPSQVVQSVVNNNMTSVVSSLGGGGVTNHISNTANNTLVQQVITANIGITGLGQTIQQSVASTVMSSLQAATTQFR